MAFRALVNRRHLALACLAAAALPASARPMAGVARLSLVGGAGQAPGPGGGIVRAGLMITMAPGFKTYWRSPGDSGLPPRIDTSASRNLRAATLLFPAPEAFEDGAGGRAVGYTRSTLFPIAIEPVDSRRPVRLVLRVSYAVCEKLCLPMEGEVAIDLPPPAAAGLTPALADALAQVPVRRPLGAVAPVTIETLDRAAAPMLAETLARATADEGVDLFVEGLAGWVIEPHGHALVGPGRHRFGLRLIDHPAGADPNQPLPLTLTLSCPRPGGGRMGVEVEHTLA